MQGQLTMFDNGENQQAFEDKFKTAKTTDDCYTPENIYRAVAGWVADTYGVDPAGFVRPFWPGGDYERFDYPEGCVVVDNPPFSILAAIMRFYLARGIRFFLFAPTLTLFSARGLDVCYLPVGAKITYENGANVNTSFVTNLDAEYRIRCVPDLYRVVDEINSRNEKAQTKQLPKYSYPPEVLTAAAAYQLSHYGVDFAVRKSACRFIAAMDAQRRAGKSAFGGVFLLGERAAAERAAAERTVATVRELSERERRWAREMDDSGAE